MGFLLQIPAPLLRNGTTRGTPLQAWLLFAVFACSLASFIALEVGRRGQRKRRTREGPGTARGDQNHVGGDG